MIDSFQLDLFDSEQIQDLNEKFDKVKSSSDAVRRGIFARHDKLQKEYEALKEKVDRLEKAIYGEKIEFKYG